MIVANISTGYLNNVELVNRGFELSVEDCGWDDLIVAELSTG